MTLFRRPTRAALPLVLAVFASAAALAFLVHLESQAALAIGLTVIAVAGWAADRFGFVAATERGAQENPTTLRLALVAAAVGVLIFLRDDTFGLLMLATVLVYVTVCLGLTIQLGFVGLSNFAAAAFMGTGGYTAAMLERLGWVPAPVMLVAAGVMAVVIGSVLILPVLRTRGHYAALTTLAFGVMFTVFLEANDALGGPQGVKLAGLSLFGWNFADDIHIGGLVIGFYANYVILAAVTAALAGLLVGLVDRSWIGVWFDAVRLDETASAVFGVEIAWWKVLAFTMGNFLMGVAGAIYAEMTAFIAPVNFLLGDSLMMISIVILGGLGNRWGVLPAALLVVLLPEKLQFIQEYRLLLYALAVIFILVARPAGLLPRRARRLATEAAR